MRDADRKLTPPWVIRVCLLLTLFAPAGYAHSIYVEGTALLEDGTPVRGGTVIVTEQEGHVGRMPDARPLRVVVTDRNGKFHTELADVRGLLDIELVPDHCDWTVAIARISWNDITEKERFEIALNPKREHCSCEETVPRLESGPN